MATLVFEIDTLKTPLKVSHCLFCVATLEHFRSFLDETSHKCDVNLKRMHSPRRRFLSSLSFLKSKVVIVMLVLSTSQLQLQLQLQLQSLTIFSRELSVLTCHHSYPLLVIINKNSLSTTAASKVLQIQTTRARTLMSTPSTPAMTTISRKSHCPRRCPRKLVEFTPGSRSIEAHGGGRFCHRKRRRQS